MINKTVLGKTMTSVYLMNQEPSEKLIDSLFVAFTEMNVVEMGAVKEYVASGRLPNLGR